MNGRPVTDAQISQALRAHLPDRAAAGLRERILDAAETTAAAAGAALVPRRAQRRGPGRPPAEPPPRGGAPGRARVRECRGGRGVAPPPA